jgi:serine/threonine protein phosphatase PrpC
VRVVLSGKTDIGRQRDLNEDALLLLLEFSLMAVADGWADTARATSRAARRLARSTTSSWSPWVTTRRGPSRNELTEEENYVYTGCGSPTGASSIAR